MQIPSSSQFILPPRETLSLIWLHLINQQITKIPHTFLQRGRTSACCCPVPEVFLFSLFTDGSLIVFVMLCYHNIEPGRLCCHCQAPDLWLLALVGLSDPPIAFAQQALNVSCGEMKAAVTSHWVQLYCFFIGLAHSEWHKSNPSITETGRLNHAENKDHVRVRLHERPTVLLTVCVYIGSIAAHPAENTTGTH